MKRYGQLIRIKPEAFEEYVEHHAEVWPGVLQKIRECNVRNYSIFHREGLLFAYFEYVGEDFDADMERMAADPTTQEWWKIMKPMQAPLESCGPDEWWASLDEVFHTD